MTNADASVEWCDEHALPRQECACGPGRHLIVQRASDITMRRVSWLWEGRIAAGTLALLAGREGLGKSTLTAWIVARVTRGDLPGDDCGRPRSVIIAATEDSWEHTLVPRLAAAGADLSRVLRVEVQTALGFTTGLSLPGDLSDVGQIVSSEDVGLLVLDPIMSRLESLDTHRDAEVRIALEPLVRMADNLGMAIIGLIHLNKSSTDPLNAVMGSKAFTAVARSVLTVVADPEDEDDRRRLLGVAKSNLGAIPPGSDVFTVETATVPSEDGLIPTGALSWHGTSTTTVKGAMADPGMEVQGALGEACEWLTDYLSMHPGTPRVEVMRDASKAGHADRTIKRAATSIGVVSRTEGFPRRAMWSLAPLSGHSRANAPGESTDKGLTGPTGVDLRKREQPPLTVGPVGPVGPVSRDEGPTADECPGCGSTDCDGECI